jgi:hypothetical protein
VSSGLPGSSKADIGCTIEIRYGTLAEVDKITAKNLVNSPPAAGHAAQPANISAGQVVGDTGIEPVTSSVSGTIWPLAARCCESLHIGLICTFEGSTRLADAWLWSRMAISLATNDLAASATVGFT